MDLWGLESSDNIINYEKLFAEYSVEQINAIENYKTSSNVLSQLTKDALDLSCEINQLEYKIDVLKGNIKKTKIDYTLQEFENSLSIIKVFGPALNEAVHQSDLISAAGSFILNLNPQDVAECVVDLTNSNNLSKNELNKNIKEIKKEIKEIKTNIVGLKAEMKENQRLQNEAKQSMNDASKKFYGND